MGFRIELNGYKVNYEGLDNLFNNHRVVGENPKMLVDEIECYVDVTYSWKWVDPITTLVSIKHSIAHVT